MGHEKLIAVVHFPRALVGSHSTRRVTRTGMLPKQQPTPARLTSKTAKLSAKKPNTPDRAINSVETTRAVFRPLESAMIPQDTEPHIVLRNNTEDKKLSCVV